MNDEFDIGMQIKQHRELIKSMQKLYESVGQTPEQLKAITEIAKPIIEQHKAMLNTLKPSIEIAESIRKNIVPSLKLIEKWQEQFIPIFDKELIENLTKWKEKKESPEYQSFIKEWGWFFSKRVYSFGDYCFGLYKIYGSTEFPNQLISWFSVKDNMHHLIENIKLKFLLRYPIIRNGINFHLEGNYASAITLLLPHTEGILWDLGQQNGKVVQKYSSEIIIKNNPQKSQKWNLKKLSEELFGNEKFFQILTNDVFCKGPRDKILHGRNVYQNEQKEITKWFSTLLLLTLWRLVDEVKNVG